MKHNSPFYDQPINTCMVQCDPEKMEKGICTCFNLLFEEDEEDIKEQTDED